MVLGFGTALVAVLFALVLNNLLLDQTSMERIVIQEEMILQADEGLYFILPMNPELKLELPEELLEDVVFGNPYAVDYAYNRLTKKGHVVRVKVT